MVILVAGPEDCCKVGQRIPSIYLNRKRFLEIAMAIGGEGNKVIRTTENGLRKGRQYQLRITQELVDEKVN